MSPRAIVTHDFRPHVFLISLCRSRPQYCANLCIVCWMNRLPHLRTLHCLCLLFHFRRIFSPGFSPCRMYIHWLYQHLWFPSSAFLLGKPFTPIVTASGWCSPMQVQGTEASTTSRGCMLDLGQCLNNRKHCMFRLHSVVSNRAHRSKIMT